jgi:hypothetical protein
MSFKRRWARPPEPDWISICERTRRGHRRPSRRLLHSYPLVPGAYADFAVGTRLSVVGSTARKLFFEGPLTSANGMVRPCSCPASDESGKGLQRQGARHVPEPQQRSCRTDQACKREQCPCQLGAVHTWHLATRLACLYHCRARCDRVGFEH